MMTRPAVPSRAGGDLLGRFKAIFTPLAQAPFRAYMGGQTVSLIGTFLQSTAQSLFVFKISGGRATSLGMVALCTAIPMIVFSPFAGTLVDRYQKRPLIIATQLGEMALAFGLALLAQFGVENLRYVYALAACLGLCEAVYFPAHQNYLATMGGAGNVRNALALNAVVINFCRIIGPALAGYLVARVGIPWSFWLNGLSFLAVVVAVAKVRGIEPAAEPAPASAESGSFFSVFRRISRSAHLSRLYLNVILINMFGQSLYTLIPALVNGDAEETGNLLACTGAGSLVAALLILPHLNALKRPAAAMSGLLIWMGACLVPAAMSGSFSIKAVCFFGAGMSTSTLIPSAIGLVQITTPLHLRGRMVAVVTMVHLGLVPLAAAVLGRLADMTTPTLTAAVSGAILAASGVWLAADKTWREWTPVEI